MSESKDRHEVAAYLQAGAVAPVFMTTDVDAALERYEALGFSVRAYRFDAGSPPVYGFICYGPGELHIARVDELDPKTNCCAAYLYVADADEVHRHWSELGAPGRVGGLVDTEYDLREFPYIDPDGNLLRVGSPL